MSSLSICHCSSVVLLYLLVLSSVFRNVDCVTSPGRGFPSLSSEKDSSEETEIVEAETRGKSNSGKGERHSLIINQIHEDEELKEILCPRSSPLIRYDLRAGKCAEMDTQAHCGHNMVFKEELDSSAYGYCDCDFENHSVPLVFHLRTSQCYPVYQQAYCRPDEWLVLSPQAKGPACQRNHCLTPSRGRSSGSGRRSKLLFPGLWHEEHQRRDSPLKLKSVSALGRSNTGGNSILVPLNGTGPCVVLGNESEYCDGRERVIIPSGDYAPRCGIEGKSERRLSIIPNACPPGSYYSIIGYCQPVWDF